MCHLSPPSLVCDPDLAINIAFPADACLRASSIAIAEFHMLCFDLRAPKRDSQMVGQYHSSHFTRTWMNDALVTLDCDGDIQWVLLLYVQPSKFSSLVVFSSASQHAVWDPTKADYLR